MSQLLVGVIAKTWHIYLFTGPIALIVRNQSISGKHNNFTFKITILFCFTLDSHIQCFECKRNYQWKTPFGFNITIFLTLECVDNYKYPFTLNIFFHFRLSNPMLRVQGWRLQLCLARTTYPVSSVRPKLPKIWRR